MDPGVRTHGMKASPPGYLCPNINAFWWVAVEMWTFEKLAYKTLSQCEGNADANNLGDYNSSPCICTGELTKWPVRPAKTQISLGICPVWSVYAVRMKKHWALNYLLSAQWRFWSNWADPRLIWVFAGRTSDCWFCRAAAQIPLDSWLHTEKPADPD